MSQPCTFVFDPLELNYRFHDKHPFNQKRLDTTLSLLHYASALPTSSIQSPRAAMYDELSLIHTADYIQAVQLASAPNPSPELLARVEHYGIATEDTPCFPGMHDAAAYTVGGSLLAADLVMTGKAAHTLHLAGGLHHAFASKGAGFCVYNDAAIAIAHLRKSYGARVLYVDTDVHHGDGVQMAFYTDPDVCTFSIHETGKYLFPGTGGVQERGEDHGFGWSINLPMEPYTEDESWVTCFRDTLERILHAFKPDVIVSQHGCDAHAFDPLSHIHCSMNIYMQIPQLLHEAAHIWCGGKWIALGGGGYNIWQVVPRAWSLLWLTMIDHPLIKELHKTRDLPLPPKWIEQWSTASPDKLPTTWLDPVEDWSPMPRRKAIESHNKVVKELALLYLPQLL